MNFTRRETMAVSGAALVATVLPLKLMASTTEPISIDAPGAVAITVLAAGNPTPGVAKFNFGAGSGSQSCTTRIRLAGTQDVIAVAEMADGSFSAAYQTVKVTIGGCGG